MSESKGKSATVGAGKMKVFIRNEAGRNGSRERETFERTQVAGFARLVAREGAGKWQVQTKREPVF